MLNCTLQRRLARHDPVLQRFPNVAAVPVAPAPPALLKLPISFAPRLPHFSSTCSLACNISALGLEQYRSTMYAFVVCCYNSSVKSLLRSALPCVAVLLRAPPALGYHAATDCTVAVGEPPPRRGCRSRIGTEQPQSLPRLVSSSQSMRVASSGRASQRLAFSTSSLCFSSYRVSSCVRTASVVISLSV